MLGGERLKEVHPYFLKVAEERGILSEELIDEVTAHRSLRGVEALPDDLKRIFVTAIDIDPTEQVAVQAIFQKHVDNAVSKTIDSGHGFDLEAGEGCVCSRTSLRMQRDNGIQGGFQTRAGAHRVRVLSPMPPVRAGDKDRLGEDLCMRTADELLYIIIQ